MKIAPPVLRVIPISDGFGTGDGLVASSVTAQAIE
jgi:hypothetical protein